MKTRKHKQKKTKKDASRPSPRTVETSNFLSVSTESSDTSNQQIGQHKAKSKTYNESDLKIRLQKLQIENDKKEEELSDSHHISPRHHKSLSMGNNNNNTNNSNHKNNNENANTINHNKTQEQLEEELAMLSRKSASLSPTSDEAALKKIRDLAYGSVKIKHNNHNDINHNNNNDNNNNSIHRIRSQSVPNSQTKNKINTNNSNANANANANAQNTNGNTNNQRNENSNHKNTNPIEKTAGNRQVWSNSCNLRCFFCFCRFFFAFRFFF